FDRALAIAQTDRGNVIADLARSGCPCKFPGYRIESRSIGQTLCAKGERFPGIGVAAGHIEGQCVAESDLMIRKCENGQTVHIGNMEGHIHCVCCTCRVLRSEGENVISCLLIAGYPCETSVGTIEF